MSGGRQTRLPSSITCPCPLPALGAWLLTVQAVLQQHETENQTPRNVHKDQLHVAFVGSRVTSGDTVRDPQEQGSGNHINCDVLSLLFHLWHFYSV